MKREGGKSMQVQLEEDAIYFSALASLRGVGTQTLSLLVSAFPTLQAFQEAPPEALEQVLRRPLAKALHERLHQQRGEWEQSLKQAEERLLQHLHSAIVPVPLTSFHYPPLLKHIPDPPLLLYAKGNLALLREIKTIAIVGTREPTLIGERVALHLARYFAQKGYTIISGLAKGIDTDAHKGALQAKGKTIAVFGTALDTVYPAENKSLAECILAEGGLFVSELALGQRSFRQAFVLRDRIQSGMSLAIVPVQTANNGGTMHTIAYAKDQQRLIACPVPSRKEAGASQYEGIHSLLQETTPYICSFQASTVRQGDILDKVQEVRRRLLPNWKEEERQFDPKTVEQPQLLTLDEIEAEEISVHPSKKRTDRPKHPRTRKKKVQPDEKSATKPLFYNADTIAYWRSPSPPAVGSQSSAYLRAQPLSLWDGQRRPDDIL